MKILFLSLIDFDSLSEKGIYTELLTELWQMGHDIYAVSPFERRSGKKEQLICKEERIFILKTAIGNTQKTGLIEKGISTITIEPLLIRALRRYFGTVSFDLILYATPPITFENVIRYMKRKNKKAQTYLMLKDIFPQNAVDLGMFSKEGLLYQYFRRKEKRLYEISDTIGCMSPENCRYLLRHNPQVRKKRIEVCPNSVRWDCKAYEKKEEKTADVRELVNRAEQESLRKRIREAYGLPMDRFILLYGGNLGKPQDIPFILQCLKDNRERKDCFFLICGNGTEYEKLKLYYESVKENENCNFKLMRELPKEEYKQLTKSCDAGLIFLDHRFTIPNFPSRVLSYMEAGIPILAATDRHTDIKDMILRKKLGDWCESTDPEHFTRMLDRMLSEPEQLKQYGENAKAYLKKHFTTRKTAEKILKSTNSQKS